MRWFAVAWGARASLSSMSTPVVIRTNCVYYLSKCQNTILGIGISYLLITCSHMATHNCIMVQYYVWPHYVHHNTFSTSHGHTHKTRTRDGCVKTYFHFFFLFRWFSVTTHSDLLYRKNSNPHQQSYLEFFAWGTSVWPLARPPAPPGPLL